eukprot:212-Pelagococcus_subviridis.AAC.5
MTFERRRRGRARDGGEGVEEEENRTDGGVRPRRPEDGRVGREDEDDFLVITIVEPILINLRGVRAVDGDCG